LMFSRRLPTMEVLAQANRVVGLVCSPVPEDCLE
jgi:hypothetical protein